MRRIFRTVVLVFVLCLSVYRATQSFASPVSFQLLSEEDGKPLMNRAVYIFNGDYKFNYVGGYEPYPYDRSAKEREWFIQVVETDQNGKFSLNVGTIGAQEIVFQVGPPYRIVDIEKSSDLSHAPSNDHIRVVLFHQGQTTGVTGNNIYDLKNKTVKTIWLDKRVEEKLFDDIVLVVKKEWVR